MKMRVFLVVLLGVFLLASMSFVNAADEKAKSSDESVTCPVTGKTLNKADAAGPYKHKDKDYYFCCQGCMDKFKADPEKYLKADAKAGCPKAADCQKDCSKKAEEKSSCCSKSADKKEEQK